MKKIRLIFVLIFLNTILVSSCHAKDYSKIIENVLITATSNREAERDLMRLEYLLSDTSIFEKKGNFFKFKYEQKVFGHTAQYLGLDGVDLLPGPNVTLEGSPEKIAQYITNEYKLNFESSKKKTAFLVEMDKHQKFLVRKHPKMDGSTIVIRAYLGP